MSNVAVMERRHQRAAKQAREALGGLHYENAHDRGGALEPVRGRRLGGGRPRPVSMPGDVGLPRDGDGVAAGMGVAAGAGLGAGTGRGGERGAGADDDGSGPGSAAPIRPRP